MNAEIRAFFDDKTITVTYLVQRSQSRRGVVIDPVLDFDPKSRARPRVLPNGC